MNNDMKKIITVALHTPRGTLKDGSLDMGLPVVLWSAPSAAKTATIKSIADRANVALKVLSPGRHGEGAFGIVPVPITGAKGEIRITYPAPSWVEGFNTGIVFLDEISNAPPSIQSPLLEVVNEKAIGDYRFPGGVRVIAAANPPEQAANGYDMSLPLCNRFGHFDVSPPSHEEYADFILSGSVAKPEAMDNFARMEQMVSDRWGVQWAKVVGPVLSFLKSNSKVLHAPPKRGETGFGSAWPSHRTWELAMRAMVGARIFFPDDRAFEQMLVQGFVGAGPATELVAYLKQQDLPDIEALLDGRATWKHNKTRLDVTHAVFGSAVALLKNKTTDNRAARAEVFADLLMETVKNGAPDIAGPSVKFMSDPANSLFAGHLNNKKLVALIHSMREFTTAIAQMQV